MSYESPQLLSDYRANPYPEGEGELSLLASVRNEGSIKQGYELLYNFLFNS